MPIPNPIGEVRSSKAEWTGCLPPRPEMAPLFPSITKSRKGQRGAYPNEARRGPGAGGEGSSRVRYGAALFTGAWSGSRWHARMGCCRIDTEGMPTMEICLHQNVSRKFALGMLDDVECDTCEEAFADQKKLRDGRVTALALSKKPENTIRKA